MRGHNVASNLPQMLEVFSGHWQRKDQTYSLNCKTVTRWHQPTYKDWWCHLFLVFGAKLEVLSRDQTSQFTCNTRNKWHHNAYRKLGSN